MGDELRYWGNEGSDSSRVDNKEHSVYAYCERCGAHMKMLVLPQRVIIKCGGDSMCSYKAWFVR